ncbi:MAG: hypothetical protein U0324_19075 [Polyangiales bacterium]
MTMKQVREDCEAGDAIVAAGRAWAGAVASRRAAQLEGLGLGGAQTESALRVAIERDMGALAVRGARLREADAALEVAARAVPDAAARRDEACRRVQDCLAQVCEVVAAVAGDLAARRLGFDWPAPRDASAVEALAARVMDCAATVWLPPVTPGVTLDLTSLLADLAADRASLARASADLREARRLELLARARRDAFWAEHARERTSAAVRLDAELRAAGLDDAADGIADATRRAAAEPASVWGEAITGALIPAINTATRGPAQPS